MKIFYKYTDIWTTQEKKLMDYQLIKIGPLKTDQIC